MSVAETNARAFRLALAMDRMAEMEAVVGSYTVTDTTRRLRPCERFVQGSADSLAAAVGRLWEQREQRLKTEEAQKKGPPDGWHVEGVAADEWSVFEGKRYRGWCQTEQQALDMAWRNVNREGTEQ